MNNLIRLGVEVARGVEDITDPEDALEIIRTDSVTTGKSAFENINFSAMLGMGRVINIQEGETYLVTKEAFRHSISGAKHEFQNDETLTRKHVEAVTVGLTTIMNEEADKIIGEITSALENPHSDLPFIQLDISKKINIYSLNVILKFAFGDVIGLSDANVSELSEAANVIVNGITNKFSSKFPVPVAIPVGENIAIKASLQKFDEYILNTINKIRNNEVEAGTNLGLLGHLMQHIPEEVSGKPKRELKYLRDQAIMVLLAGHETVAASLPFLFKELDSNPTHRSALENSDLSTELIKGYVYENLRHHPPVRAFWRVLSKPFTLRSSGKQLKPGKVVKFEITSFTQNEDLFKNPREFNPSRFIRRTANSANKIGSVNPENFWNALIFGKGPHMCVGADLANTEATVLVQKLFGLFKQRNFGYDYVGDEGIEEGMTTRLQGATLRIYKNVA